MPTLTKVYQYYEQIPIVNNTVAVHIEGEQYAASPKGNRISIKS